MTQLARAAARPYGGAAAVEAATDPSPAVRAVADSLVVLVRSFQRAKARLAAESPDGEWSSKILLRHLAGTGPMRASGLAESLHFDPSTVSRQVTTLVRHGMLEREADPEDGRACLLVLTPRARQVVADHEDQRLRRFAAVFDDWTPDERDRFAALFARFVRDFDSIPEHATPHLPKDSQ